MVSDDRSNDGSVSSSGNKELPPLPGHPRVLDPEASPALVGAEPAMFAFQAETMDLAERQALLDKLMGPVGQDQQELLQGIRSRLDRVGLRPPGVQVRFQDLTVYANIHVGSRATPTVLNSYRNAVEGILQSCFAMKNSKRKFVILNSLSGVLVPSRFTLLLGPPASGKSTLLKALSNQLRRSSGAKVYGSIKYNGLSFNQFASERAAVYVEQTDEQIAQLTVRDTLEFASRCQGTGNYARELEEVLLKEKQEGIHPDPAVDAFMRARAGRDKQGSIVTDQVLRVLGLNVCADTMIGDDMTRGISGGQRKRVTTGEGLVAPSSVFFFDEISTGLDSSTTFLIMKALRDLAHVSNATVLVALLQPDPETFNLFDDVMLLSEGRLIYHGAREEILPFFARMGFTLPARVAIADFLQEVTSKSDQGIYWSSRPEEYTYITVADMAYRFQAEVESGVISTPELLGPVSADSADLSCTEADSAPSTVSGADTPLLETKPYALCGWEAFKACAGREANLMDTMKAVYIIRVIQAGVLAGIVGTLLLRTQVHPGTLDGGLLYMGSLFLTVLYITFSTLMELTFTVDRLPVFFRQRARKFYQTWAYHLPPSLLHMPFSVAEALTWSAVIYFTIGFAPEVGRFFVYVLIVFIQHYMAVSMFRMAGAVMQNMISAYTAGAFLMLICFLLGGFLIAKPDLHVWIRWGYWLNPLAYTTRALFVNEFTASRWQEVFYLSVFVFPDDPPSTLGGFILKQWGFPEQYWWVWICIGAMVVCTIIFNLIGYLALAYLPQWKYGGIAVSEQAMAEREAVGPSRPLPFVSPAISLKGVQSFQSLARPPTRTLSGATSLGEGTETVESSVRGSPMVPASIYNTAGAATPPARAGSVPGSASTSLSATPARLVLTPAGSINLSPSPSPMQQVSTPKLGTSDALPRAESFPCPFTGVVDVLPSESLGVEGVDTTVLYGSEPRASTPPPPEQQSALQPLPAPEQGTLLHTWRSMRSLHQTSSGGLADRGLPSPASGGALQKSFHSVLGVGGRDPSEAAACSTTAAASAGITDATLFYTARSLGGSEGSGPSTTSTESKAEPPSAPVSTATLPASPFQQLVYAGPPCPDGIPHQASAGPSSTAGSGLVELPGLAVRGVSNAQGPSACSSPDKWACFNPRRSFQEERSAMEHDMLMSQRMSARLRKISNRVSADAVSPMKYGVHRGMVLPFDPMTLTFTDVRYSVPIQSREGKANAKAQGLPPVLELLKGVTGAFRPGVLTALMGVTGAGKTTLMDVLAGRKTTGTITGEICVNGFPWQRDSFVRVSGYVEQFDVHSPQATVWESLMFSARIRAPRAIDRATLEAFVDEVIELVELGPLRDTLVGGSGEGSGLSVEQRKRVSVAVELVANPAIVFMDEPTTGLDARAAAIVMRAVRNIVDTGRTIVCTIHQPSIQIFEAFDELLLLKQGGRQIYYGPTGMNSEKLIKYFSRIPGVVPIKDGQNPASWMLETTSAAEEERFGVDFAEVYQRSPLAMRSQDLVQQLAVAPPGKKPLEFRYRYAQPLWMQYGLLLRRHWLTYWRWPSYNGTRYLLTVGIGLLFMFIFWGLGRQRDTIKDIINVQGSLYMVTLFLGVLNSMMVQPVMLAERRVFWRERAAGLYAVLPWSTAQLTVEVVYNLVQGVLYSCIVYFSIGFGTDARKFFWFMVFMTLTLMYFTYVGVMTVALTPNLMLATLYASGLYALFNLFAGFIMPRPAMPVWWSWYYYCNPLAWGVYGLMDSQLGGDIVNWVIAPPPLSSYVPVAKLLRVYFGYKPGMLPNIVLILCSFTIFFWLISVLALKFFNFQRR